MCFIASGNIFSCPFENPTMVLKNTVRLKKMKPSQSSALPSQSTVVKKYVVHWETIVYLLFCCSRHDPSTLNTRSLAVLGAITQNAFPARPLRSGNCNLWSGHHWRMFLSTSYDKPADHMRLSKHFLIVYVQYITIVISISTFTIQSSLVPVHHVMRTGRLPCVQWHLRGIQISNFPISTQVFLSRKLISAVRTLVLSLPLNFPTASQFWSN